MEGGCCPRKRVNGAGGGGKVKFRPVFSKEQEFPSRHNKLYSWIGVSKKTRALNRIPYSVKCDGKGGGEHRKSLIRRKGDFKERKTVARLWQRSIACLTGMVRGT